MLSIMKWSRRCGAKPRAENPLLSEIQTFFVYGQKANVLITDSGTMFTESKGMTTLNQMLMSYLQIMTSRDSISTQWTVITFGDDDYIVGWYAKNKKLSAVSSI